MFWFGALCLEGSSGRLAQLRHADGRTNSRNAGQTTRNVDRQNGVDTDAVGALLKEARRVIVAARSALF